jgi:hypothetical protein
VHVPGWVVGAACKRVDLSRPVANLGRGGSLGRLTAHGQSFRGSIVASVDLVSGNCES